MQAGELPAEAVGRSRVLHIQPVGQPNASQPKQGGQVFHQGRHMRVRVAVERAEQFGQGKIAPDHRQDSQHHQGHGHDLGRFMNMVGNLGIRTVFSPKRDKE